MAAPKMGLILAYVTINKCYNSPMPGTSPTTAPLPHNPTALQMPYPVPRILKLRQRRKPRPTAARLGLGCSAIASLGLILLGILAALLYADLTRDLPPVQNIPAILEPPSGILLQTTRIYDRNGLHILTLQNKATQERQYLRYIPPGLTSPDDSAALPESLMTATLAASDPDFWAHPGFPIPGLHVTDRPTLAQRLVSDLLLAGERPSLRRELRQRLLAAQLTAHYGRIKILEWYLNSAYYGHLAYGADAAARLYFDKPAASLSLAQAAALAAIAESPNLNPFDAPQEALSRQKIVIQNMLHYRMISPEEGIAASRQDLNFVPPHPDQWAYDALNLGQYPAFLEMLFQQIETKIPRRRLERGGLRLYTTLDSDLQAQAVCALKAQQAQLAGQPLSEESASCPAARLLPTLSGADVITSTATAELVILDPLTGQMLALVGEPPIDLAGSILPAHPAGSLSTSFIYLTAFTRGLSPASLVWDIPAEADLSSQSPEYHGPMRLRIAQANDYLNPAQTVLSLVGIENVWRTARQFGLLTGPNPLQQTPFIPTVPTVLGDVNLITLSQAFGALANQGLLVGKALELAPANAAPGQPPSLQPVAILRVEETDSGRILLEWNAAQTRPILTPQLAYLMTDVLSDEPARWPSLGHPNPLEIGRQAAARLASSSVSDGSALQSAAWAIGYTPQRVAGVWLGSAQPTSGSSQLYTQAAAGLWHALMQYAMRNLPAQEWSVPAGISRIKVCDPSGMLPTRYCPNIVEEVFASGSEPLQADTLYQAVSVNRQTGRLATVFTPLDLVEPRVFFIAPPEAQTWASQSKLEVPPQVYDTVPLVPPRWPGADILSPHMFAILRGSVEIHGTAGGEEFSYFRLQVGPGMNPQTWQQIGSDGVSPINNALLATWDTTGLNGLYAIQLLVVKSDQSLQRTTVLVTIDNTPPQVQIDYPTNAAQINLDHGRIIFQVSANDDLGLNNLTLYLDGKLLTTFIQPPYAAGWQATPGQHTLRVLAIDQAGNTAETTLHFSVR